jgi:hypothetical protein
MFWKKKKKKRERERNASWLVSGQFASVFFFFFFLFLCFNQQSKGGSIEKKGLYRSNTKNRYILQYQAQRARQLRDKQNQGLGGPDKPHVVVCWLACRWRTYIERHRDSWILTPSLFLFFKKKIKFFYFN